MGEEANDFDYDYDGDASSVSHRYIDKMASFNTIIMSAWLLYRPCSIKFRS